MHGFFSTILKLAIMHRALDDVLNHKPILEVNIFVGTKTIGTIQFVIRTTIDVKSTFSMVKTNEILNFNFFKCAGANPVTYDFTQLTFFNSTQSKVLIHQHR